MSREKTTDIDCFHVSNQLKEFLQTQNLQIAQVTQRKGKKKQPIKGTSAILNIGTQLIILGPSATTTLLIRGIKKNKSQIYAEKKDGQAEGKGSLHS